MAHVENRCVIGVDPGATGAITLLCGDAIRVYDVPTSIVNRNNKARRRVDPYALQALVVQLSTFSPERIVIEDVWGMPGQSGPASHQFGVICGQVSQAFIGAGLRIELVPAATWKKAAGLSPDKKQSLAMARERWGATGYFKREKDHDRAESALLALYALTAPPAVAAKPPVKRRAPIKGAAQGKRKKRVTK